MRVQAHKSCGSDAGFFTESSIGFKTAATGLFSDASYCSQADRPHPTLKDGVELCKTHPVAGSFTVLLSALLAMFDDILGTCFLPSSSPAHGSLINGTPCDGHSITFVSQTDKTAV